MGRTGGGLYRPRRQDSPPVLALLLSLPHQPRLPGLHPALHELKRSNHASIPTPALCTSAIEPLDLSSKHDSRNVYCRPP